MDLGEAARLKAEVLAAGPERLAKLSGREFQELMYWIVIERYIGTGKRIAVTNAPRGEVDFVVEEYPASRDPLGIEQTVVKHFMECKHYKRSFEMMDVAKLFCAALRHNPNSISLISTSDLQPQAQEYAAFLFGENGGAGRAGNVIFRNLRAEWLIDPEWRLERPSRRAPATEIPLGIRVTGWTLVERGAFHDRELAREASGEERVQLLAGWHYRLVVCGTFAWEGSGQIPEMWLREMSGSAEFIAPEEPACFHGHSFSVSFESNAESIAGPDGSKAWALEIRSRGARQTVLPLTLPALRLGAGERLPLRDLREELSLQMGREVLDGDCRVLFVRGEAGAGKSYLCSQIAEHVRFELRRPAHSFTVDGSADASLFARILLRLLLPPAANGGVDTEFAACIAAEALRKWIPSGVGLDPDVIVGAILHGGAEASRPELVIPILSSLLVRGGDVLVILQDCHELTGPALNGVASLVGSLDELGWGGVRLVLESRTGGAMSEWDGFVARIQARLHGRFRDVEVRPFTQAQLQAQLMERFVALTPEVSAALWRKTAGNPLMLSSLLHQYLDVGVVAPVATAHGERLLIRNPLAIADEELVDAVHKATNILDARISSLEVPATLAESLSGGPLALLGLLALTEGLLPAPRVFGHSGVGQAERPRVVRWLVRERILQPGAAADRVVFAHDLIRGACVRLGRRDARTVAAAEALLDSLRGDTLPELYLMARLAEFVGDAAAARGYLDEGQRRARRAYQYQWARRLQVALWRLLEAQPADSGRERLARVTLLYELGWSEHNTGSYAAARDYLGLAYRLAREAPADAVDWTPEMRRNALSRLDHRLMNVAFELGDVAGMTESGRRVLETVPDHTILSKIVSRLFIFYIELGLVEHARVLAEAGLELSGASESPEVHAILSTDVGSFLMLAEPQAALEVFRQGPALARSSRQLLHNEHWVRMGELVAHGTVPPAGERVRFHRRLEEHGMTTLVGAFLSYEAVVQVVEGNLSGAEDLLRQANTHALTYEQVLFRGVVVNNALVCALLQGNIGWARRCAAELADFLRTLGDGRRRAAESAPDLLDRYAAARARLYPLPVLEPVLRVSTLSVPVSGSIIPGLLNLAGLAGTGDPVLDEAAAVAAELAGGWVPATYSLEAALHPSLRREWRGRPLFLCP